MWENKIDWKPIRENKQGMNDCASHLLFIMAIKNNMKGIQFTGTSKTP